MICPSQFGAIADGKSNLLQREFSSLEEAREVYPLAESLTDEADWCALQAAINEAVERAAPLCLESRRYTTNKTLHARGSLTIREGLIAHYGGQTALTVEADGPYSVLRATDLTLQATSTTRWTGSGLDLGRCWKSNLTNVIVRRFDRGVTLRGVNGSAFHCCDFSESTNNLTITAHSKGTPSNANRFTSCRFNDCKGEDSIHIAHDPVRGQGAAATSVSFDGCWIEDNGKLAVRVSSGNCLTFADCYFEGADERYVHAEPSTDPVSSVLTLNLRGNLFGHLRQEGSAVYLSPYVYGATLVGNRFAPGSVPVINEGHHLRAVGNLHMEDA